MTKRTCCCHKSNWKSTFAFKCSTAWNHLPSTQKKLVFSRCFKCGWHQLWFYHCVLLLNLSKEKVLLFLLVRGLGGVMPSSLFCGRPSLHRFPGITSGGQTGEPPPPAFHLVALSGYTATCFNTQIKTWLKELARKINSYKFQFWKLQGQI